MNVQRIKLLVWVAALLAGGGLAWEVSDFLGNREALERPVSTELQENVLENIEEPELPSDDRLDYQDVLDVFRGMNWTGKADPKPVELPTDGETSEPPKTPVADLLRVLYLQVDQQDGSTSLAFVEYLDPALASRVVEPSDRLLYVDSRLPEPQDGIRVEAITTAGVRFVFDEEGREPETLQHDPFPKESPGITVVDKAVMPTFDRQIVARPENRPFNPRETYQYRRNEYLIGTDVAAELDRDYTRILSQELKYRSHRDRSGKVDGIQVIEVKKGSLPAKHGVTPGEILKSINGHRVTSVNEAVAYVKQASSTTTLWEVVFEKQGKEFTRTYRSPVTE